MATARPSNATPGNQHASPHETTPEQQAKIRLVFQSELGTPQVQLINVESTVLYNALSTKRHADVDAEDDGSFHSEVLKNAIDLLQRLHRCAPLYLKMAAGYRQRVANFFAKEVFCRTFCSDIEGFDNKDNPRAWIDVFHFFQAMKKIWDGSLLGGLKVSGRDVAAVGFDARDEVAKSETRTRKGAVLWALMGLASKDIDRYGSAEHETWCVEAAVRVGMWRERLKEDKDSLFRLPVEDGWGSHSDDVLPERDDDAMKLFEELETKLRAFYLKCKEKMPEQAIVLPEIPKELPARAVTPEADQEDDNRDQQGPEEITQRDGTGEEMTFETSIPHHIWQVLFPEKNPQEGLVPKSSITHHTDLENEVPSKNVPQKNGHNQKTFTLFTHEHPTLQKIITKDPKESIRPVDHSGKALERAMERIYSVLRANGLEPA
ncbi:hypothetical protein INS49_007957 [Diaporthe citri]|uniref:uncharacterized protein n=1 Tax=Diaporthe citri TaxID=83186 RepID=UPI001C7F34F2|nr:uncharacterized protein INS49_007957 [Diaporthe citri]KAG6362862.1 hypothetical protein INS49_007957 [Diaporthe citri]